MNKGGRPRKKKEESAYQTLHIRMYPSDAEMLETLCKCYALSKSELIRKLIFSAYCKYIDDYKGG